MKFEKFAQRAAVRGAFSRPTVFGFCALVGWHLLGGGNVARAAQVNAVGYVNASYPNGYVLIANQVSNRENQVDQIYPFVAEGTRLVKFDGQNWLTNEFIAGSWMIPDMTLSPGEAALLRSPGAWTHTWAGSILQGELKVFIPAGVSLRSSLIPQSGKLSQVLRFPEVVGTRIYRVDNTTGLWLLRATCTETGWEPEEPVLNVGEGFYVEAPREFVWSRTFVVNQGDSPMATAIHITAQPQSQQINLGDAFWLSVVASSTNRLSYQWQLNGNDIPDATDPTLVIAKAEDRHVGRYWAKVWDDKSWMWTDVVSVQLTGSEPPRLTIHQDSQGRGMLLTTQGTAGRTTVIETSTNLVQWAELGGAEQVDTNSVLDRVSGQPAVRFYRLKVN
jgi:hypothetical protein